MQPMPVFLFAAILSAAVSICDAGGQQSIEQPVFRSGIVSSATPSHQIEVVTDIQGATDLYLVVSDAGDGITFDWCNWLNPKLVGESKSLDLAKMTWKSARSGWGSVQVGKNCNGGPMNVYGTRHENGIGTHAQSIIHYELPTDHAYQQFTAIAALDMGGVNQENDAVRETVEFLVFTEKPPAEFWDSAQGGVSAADHEAEQATSQFDIHPELDITLFASEPMLVNPTNIDIDHLGRVWVCEVVNYRGKRNTRPQGDRILVLEDTDQDGRADKSTVFYQGRDIDSVHGLCVLANRVIVSAGSEVFSLFDDNEDLRADRKEVMFTGISGTQHDHGIHAFVFGPDGKLYFNFGNEGRQIRDKDGNPIMDSSGNVVSDHARPYQQGMVFRCDLDGGNFETLAWNFRNNWEVCVDSYGRMWQSDNDDDGNRAVRINYVMPFGNYGFRDEFTRAGWRTERMGMAEEIPSRHWHQNDPGVVPNLLQTGAGSPTGICVYEGNALPEIFHNQVIHCDAGPNIVRAYVTEPDGAGFKARIVNIMDGARHNQWFRPSDVCVAPDGSLIVADWYDPGVGGHGMGDVQRGRLFRVTARGKGKVYRIPSWDEMNSDRTLRLLTSPNQAARYQGWLALGNAENREDLVRALRSTNPRHRLRAVWTAVNFNDLNNGPDIDLASLLNDSDPDVRAAVIRVCSRFRDRIDLSSILKNEQLINDPELAVRRELLIALSERHADPVPGDLRAEAWAALAAQHVPGDRWYLEALGIAASGQWDECMRQLLAKHTVELTVWRDLVWRSRASQSPEWLAEIILDPQVSRKECQRYLRAYDFLNDLEPAMALTGLATAADPLADDKSQLVFVEALGRLPAESITPPLTTKLKRYLDESGDSAELVRIVTKFGLNDRNEQLLELALQHGATQQGIDALEAALHHEGAPLVRQAIRNSDEPGFDNWMRLLERSRSGYATHVLSHYAADTAMPLERRKRSVMALGNSLHGAQRIVKWVEESAAEPDLHPAIVAALHGTNWPEIQSFANEHFPLPPGKGDKPLPSLRLLMKLNGDVQRGQELFSGAGTCAKCHVVNGVGTEVGPDLSEIGGKLSRQAMFENILFPSAAVSHGYENWSVLTLDGEMITGVKVSDSSEFVELKDAEGIAHRIDIDDIDELRQQSLSMMPDDLHKDLSDQDLSDIVAYMMSLKTAVNPPADNK